ncbi:hypothetical protein ACH4GK_42800, partial [Streptomyces rimosus]
MAKASDPKVAVLAASRSLYPWSEKITDEVFLASPFCAPRDVVQVKYEMVRRVRFDKVPVAEAARAFGYCRQTYYEATPAARSSATTRRATAGRRTPSGWRPRASPG